MRLWFDCSHKNTTFPITLPDHARKVSATINGSAHRTYIACLDCGREIPYSWELMKPLPRRHVALKAGVPGQIPTAA